MDEVIKISGLKLKWTAFLILALVLFSCKNDNQIFLVNNGKSDYRIVISKSADSITKFAALEFQKYLFKVSGAELEIISDTVQTDDKEIIIGSSSRTELINNSVLNADGFVIKTIDGKLFIYGGAEKGNLYGVYTFFEDYLNCRYFSADAIIIPEKKSIHLDQIDIREESVFDFHELHMPMAINDRSYRDWHKLDIKEGKNKWGMFVHTFDDLVPPEKYFKTHPEYFSYLNVQRIPDGQLCLSNPEVFELVIDGLRERMGKNPKALYWSVSQNDTYKACECENCRNEYEQYGGYSGAMLNFVNKVAAVFPDRIISMLAYQYTRSAPKNIKPAANVNIMFCSIECNRSRPLATDPGSASFRKDTEDWCKLTNNIFMWDYVVQFRSLVSPFPNFRVLQPNIQFFRDNGIKMMFQQGSGGLISEFVELRSYIIAKLLWNPDTDIDGIIDDFLNGYYGPAGKFIKEYITKMHNELELSGGDLGIYGYPYDGINTYLTPELIIDYEKFFDEAELAAADFPDYLKRVKIARLPIEFAIIDISLRDVNEELSFFKRSEGRIVVREDMLKRLYQLTDQSREAKITRYWEHGNYPEDYRKTVERFARSSMQLHLALQKPVQLLTQSSEKYEVGGGAALTDGLKGINDYHFNWLGFEGPDLIAIIDLENETEIHSIEADFLQEIKSWVFLPESVECLISSDGKIFTAISKQINDISEYTEGTFVHTFKSGFVPVKARYIKIVAKNKGICPDWHPGATYPSWIFCDEVIVL